MSMTVDQWVERAFSQIPGARPEQRDDLYQVQFDALLQLGKVVSNASLRQTLTRDFQVATIGGSGDLNTATLVGGASLASANIYAVVFDTIKRGKATHPDSTEPIQFERGPTQAVDKPKRDTFGYIYGTLSADAIYLRKEDGSPVSDQPNCIFKASFAPLFPFFATASPTIQALEDLLVSIGVKLVMPQILQPAEQQILAAPSTETS